MLIPHTDAQVKYSSKTWSMVILSIDYDAAVNKLQGNAFYLSNPTSPITSSIIVGPPAANMNMLQSTPPSYKSYLDTATFDHPVVFTDAIPADLKMYVGGAGPGGGGYQTGGCFDISSLVFLPNYVPTGMALAEGAAGFADFMYGHF
jgi:hypothetical protein